MTASNLRIRRTGDRFFVYQTEDGKRYASLNTPFGSRDAARAWITSVITATTGQGLR